MIRIAIALAVAMFSAGSAQSCNGWNCGPPTLITTPGTNSSASGNTELLDGCVIDAIGRVPKADGLKVTKSSYEYRDTVQVYGSQVEFWRVFVSVDLQGRQANYRWLCRVNANRTADLLRDPN